MSTHVMSTRTGNLTGSARVLNDTIVNFYNAIQNWKSSLAHGVDIIQMIQTHIENSDFVEEKCEEMGQLLSNMSSNIDSMKENEQKLYNLVMLNKGASLSACLSWSYSKIADAVHIISDAYKKEMDFRKKLGSSLYKKTLSELNIIIIFWIHCGQVDNQMEAYMEALLRECMLKS